MLKDFLKKYENICRFLYLVKNNLKGFRILFDVDNWGDRIVFLGLIKILWEYCLFSSFLGNFIVFYLFILLIIVIMGIMGSVVFLGFVVLNVLDDFEIVCCNVFYERIDDLMMDIVKCVLKNKYVEEI